MSLFEKLKSLPSKKKKEMPTAEILEILERIVLHRDSMDKEQQDLAFDLSDELENRELSPQDIHRLIICEESIQIETNWV